MDKIGVVGLGYIGLPIVASLASVGFEVIGMDINEAKVLNLIETKTPDFYEVGLNEALTRYHLQISYTDSYGKLLESCHTIIITVGTALRPDGSPNMAGLKYCQESIAPLIKKGHTVVLKSTVPVGTTRRFADALSNESGLVLGQDLFVAYSPERTIEGHALHELHFLPKIIGGIDPESTEKASETLGRLGGAIVKVKSPELAEMCKLVDNTFRSTSIAFANEIGAICEALGLDSYDLVSAINEGYERTSLFRSGLGAGGPCLSKDPTILALDAQGLGVPVDIIGAAITSNKEATIRIARVVDEFLNEQRIQSPKVAMMGLAFKGVPETDDVRESPASLIYEYLSQKIPRLDFQCFDPVVRNFVGLSVSSDMLGTLQGANVLLFLTNHSTLMGVQSADIKNAATERPLLVVDCWHNIKNPSALNMDGIKVLRIGDGSI